MKWEELIAEARAAGYLKFSADGIAVLQNDKTSNPAESESTEGKKKDSNDNE